MYDDDNGRQLEAHEYRPRKTIYEMVKAWTTTHTNVLKERKVEMQGNSNDTSEEVVVVDCCHSVYAKMFKTYEK